MHLEGSEITKRGLANISEFCTVSKLKQELDTIDMLLMQNDSVNNKQVYRGFY
jgi:hypothetical protein